MKKLWKKLNKWMSRPNPEGVTGWDALFMMTMPTAIFLFLTNLMLWLAKPEQAWIGDILFPMAK